MNVKFTVASTVLRRAIFVALPEPSPVEYGNTLDVPFVYHPTIAIGVRPDGCGTVTHFVPFAVIDTFATSTACIENFGYFFIVDIMALLLMRLC